MAKIAVGTAQFGMDYGINNKKGRVPALEVDEILSIAVKSGIDTVDTASAYGLSEDALGNFMKSTGNSLKVISKFSGGKGIGAEKMLKLTLNKLNLPKIYGYLLHNYECYQSNQIVWEELRKLKGLGKVEKIGFSLYRVLELESILNDKLEIDLLQVPYSVFDQRFKPFFPELKKRKIEIHIRSVFLQGLVFKKPSQLRGQFKEIKANIEKLNLLSEETGIPVFGLCLNFALKEEHIDKVVVGVDGIGHFVEVLKAEDFSGKMDSIMPRLYPLSLSNEKIILPFNWN